MRIWTEENIRKKTGTTEILRIARASLGQHSVGFILDWYALISSVSRQGGLVNACHLKAERKFNSMNSVLPEPNSRVEIPDGLKDFTINRFEMSQIISRCPEIV